MKPDVYKSGTALEVLANMVGCAKRDQRTLIEAYESQVELSAEDKKAIRDAGKWIRDFNLLHADLYVMIQSQGENDG